jgi:ubiquinone/menaquinone biosynthesis C-methylase UbiE
MHHFEKPPMTVLDLGCGSGFWAIEAAKQWTVSTSTFYSAWPLTRYNQTSSIVGYDFQDIQPNLFSSKEHEDIAYRVRWVHGNLSVFLLVP